MARQLWRHLQARRVCGVVVGMRDAGELVCVGCGVAVPVSALWDHFAGRRECGQVVGMYGAS